MKTRCFVFQKLPNLLWLLFLLLSAAVHAEDYTWSTNNGAITITRYIGFVGDVPIPPTLGGLVVTSIAPEAFKNCIGLKSVVIPDSVISIGGGSDSWGTHGAFQGCTSLTNAIVGNSVTSIGLFAFNGCTGLKSVTIGSSVTSIGDYSFAGSGLTSVTIPDLVISSIGNHAFDGCAALTNAVIGNNITSIGNNAFYQCALLKSVTIGNSVTSIAPEAFKNCTGLKSVVIPDSVISIGGGSDSWGTHGAFQSCTSLTNAIVGNGVTSIGDYAFASCTNLVGVYFLGDAPTSVGSNVFAGDNSATVYSLVGTTGFGTTFAGRPTALWTAPSLVTLTLYVRNGSTSGPLLSGAQVTGTDGAGQSFHQTTGTGGYVTITGSPGTWQFTTSDTGYTTVSWSQSITATGQRDAFLTATVVGTPILSVTPSSPQPVSAIAGTITLNVSNTGGGTMSYSASVTSGSAWLHISSGASGGNSGTIMVSYDQNTGTQHSGTIQVTASGASGSPVPVTITQAASGTGNKIIGIALCSGSLKCSGLSTPVFIQRYPVTDTTTPIDPHLRTWIIIHGCEDSSANPWVSGPTGLAAAITNIYPSDQILMIDWTDAAKQANPIDTTEEDWIKPVAAWAAGQLVDYGFAGSDLNLIGHSWGGSMSAEIAELIPYIRGHTVNLVNSIIALDPAHDGAGSFNPDNQTADNGTPEIDFARNSRFSWAFHSSELGSVVTPITAHEAIYVDMNTGLGQFSAHNNIRDLFINILTNANRISQRFTLARLLDQSGGSSTDFITRGPWDPNHLVYDGLHGILTGYDAALKAASGGLTPYSLTYYDKTTGKKVTEYAIETQSPNLTIAFPANNATVTSASLTVTGTASDSGRGNSGIASVTVNGFSASGGTANTANTANWSAKITLSPGVNTITVVAKDKPKNTSQQQISVTYNVVPLAITTTHLTAGRIKTQYTGGTLQATGGTAPYKWSLATGSKLPTGLTLNATTGAISGKPTNAGTFSFTVTVTDSATKKQTATSQPLTLTITAVP